LGFQIDFIESYRVADVTSNKWWAVTARDSLTTMPGAERAALKVFGEIAEK
jgi:hypothetical protein